MKKLVVFSFLLFLTSICYSQSLGLSGSILDYNSYSDLGFGVNLEYGFSISENADLTISTSLLSASQKDEVYNLSYFQIPLTAGARYYITRRLFSPYIGIEIGGSYSKVDRIETVRFNSALSPNDHQELVRYREVNFGFGTMVGTLIDISKNIDLNISARQYNVIKTPSSFLTWNVGVIYNMM